MISVCRSCARWTSSWSRACVAPLLDRFDGEPGQVGDQHRHDHREARQRCGDGDAAPVGTQEAEQSVERGHSCAVNDYRTVAASRARKLDGCPIRPSCRAVRRHRRGPLRHAAPTSRSCATRAARASRCAVAPVRIQPIRATRASRCCQCAGYERAGGEKLAVDEELARRADTRTLLVPAALLGEHLSIAISRRRRPWSAPRLRRRAPRSRRSRGCGPARRRRSTPSSAIPAAISRIVVSASGEADPVGVEQRRVRGPGSRSRQRADRAGDERLGRSARFETRRWAAGRPRRERARSS